MHGNFSDPCIRFSQVIHLLIIQPLPMTMRLYGKFLNVSGNFMFILFLQLIGKETDVNKGFPFGEDIDEFLENVVDDFLIKS